MAGNPPGGVDALVAGSPFGLVENEMIRGLAVRLGVVALVIGLGRSEYKSRKEQHD